MDRHHHRPLPAADDCIETPLRNTRGHLFQIIDMSDWLIEAASDGYESRWNGFRWAVRINAHNWYEAHYPNHDHTTCEVLNTADPILCEDAGKSRSMTSTASSGPSASSTQNLNSRPVISHGTETLATN